MILSFRSRLARLSWSSWSSKLMACALIAFFTNAGLAADLSALKIRNFPSHIQTWPEIEASIRNGLPPDAEIKVSGQSLTLSQGGHQYQVMLYNGKIIQYSTATLEEYHLSEPVQFGRTVNRSIQDLIQRDSTLQFISHLMNSLGVDVHETGLHQSKLDHRSALIFLDHGKAPVIELSGRYAKHPIFGFAHESQHLLNHALLDSYVAQIFGSRNHEMRLYLKSFLDELLAVSAEVRLYHRLASDYPFLANQELSLISKMPASELKKHVFDKWRGFYHWPELVLKESLAAAIDLGALIDGAMSFHRRFTLRDDVPKYLAVLTEFSQKRNPKTLDENVIASPNNAHLPWLYRPESGASFPIRTIWVPVKHVDIALDEEQLPPDLKSELIRTIDGQPHVAIFVHPLSEERYKDLILHFESTFEYVATPDSSNRTLLIRSMKSDTIFYLMIPGFSHLSSLSGSFEIPGASGSAKSCSEIFK